MHAGEKYREKKIDRERSGEKLEKPMEWGGREKKTDEEGGKYWLEKKQKKKRRERKKRRRERREKLGGRETENV